MPASALCCLFLKSTQIMEKHESCKGKSMSVFPITRAKKKKEMLHLPRCHLIKTVHAKKTFIRLHEFRLQVVDEDFINMLLVE